MPAEAPRHLPATPDDLTAWCGRPVRVCGKCGSKNIRVDCSMCGDSTFDHECNDGCRDCGGPEIRAFDPTGATTGCLQAFCRGLYGIPSMHVVPEDPTATVWTVCACNETGTYEVDGPDGRSIRGPTEPAAWRAAILAHPSRSELR